MKITIPALECKYQIIIGGHQKRLIQEAVNLLINDIKRNYAETLLEHKTSLDGLDELKELLLHMHSYEEKAKEEGWEKPIHDFTA